MPCYKFSPTYHHISTVEQKSSFPSIGRDSLLPVVAAEHRPGASRCPVPRAPSLARHGLATRPAALRPPLASPAQAWACSRLFYEKSAKTDCPTGSPFTFQKEGHLIVAAVDPRRDLILDRVSLLSRDRLLPLLPQLPDKIPYGIGIDSVV